MQPLRLCLLALFSSAALIPGSLMAPAASSVETKQMFLERCNDYVSNRHSELFSVKPSCDSLWAKFQTAAVESCPPDKSGLDSLMTLADHSLPKDKVIFWSGVRDLVLKLRDCSNLGWFMLEDTLMGYALNELNWCLQSKCGACDKNPVWIAASEWLARKATGTTAVILDASRTSPYYEGTTFAKYELPLISLPRVTSFNIYLVNSVDGTSKTDSCNHESVNKLKKTLDYKEISHNCAENPGFLVDIQKLDANRCKVTKGSNDLQPSFLWIFSAFFLSAVATRNTR